VVLFSAVVKLYVESVDPAEVAACVAAKATRGVVTRASSLATAAAAGGTAVDALRALCAVANGPVFVEVAAGDRDAMMREARTWMAVAANVVAALPATDPGVEAVRALGTERIRAALGACTSAERALAAARAGAVHVAVPVAREGKGPDGKVLDGYDVVRKLAALFRTYDAPTEVVAAAIRIPTDIIDAALAGAHGVAAPPAVVRALDAESTRTADLGRR
jgi:transaldolase